MGLITVYFIHILSKNVFVLVVFCDVPYSRRNERMISICLIGFIIGWRIKRTQIIPSIGLFYKNVGFYLEGV